MGAELLVRGASRLAVAAGVPPLLIGLTVVAAGTGSPELAVSVRAALAGRADLALGNVVGSNILNVLLILGASALIAPLVVDRDLVRRDVPLMIGASAVTLLLALDGRIGRLDGLLLLAGALGYAVHLVRGAVGTGGPRGAVGRTADSAGNGVAGAGGLRPGPAALVVAGLLAAAGLGVLVLGARWFVLGATAAARSLGVSELIIGLTIVALGTSLPEVATSLLASLRGERDIAVGNVVGSNLFNLLVVLGLSAALAPAGLVVARSALRLDLPVMTAVAVACLPVFFTGRAISRWEGLLFLAYYAAYTAYLALDATRSAALPTYTVVMLGFVVPLTAVTLGAVAAREWRTRARPGA